MSSAKDGSGGAACASIDSAARRERPRRGERGLTVVVRVDDHVRGPLVVEHHDLLVVSHRLSSAAGNPDILGFDRRHDHNIIEARTDTYGIVRVEWAPSDRPLEAEPRADQPDQRSTSIASTGPMARCCG